jgi:hypothetical protein
MAPMYFNVSMGRMQNRFDMIEFMARTHIDPFKLGPVNILSMNIVFSCGSTMVELVGSTLVDQVVVILPPRCCRISPAIYHVLIAIPIQW